MTEENTKYNAYIERRNELLTVQAANATSQDKAILTLSSAGFGFLLSYSSSNIETNNFLYILTLCLFGAATFLVILSYLIVQLEVHFEYNDNEKQFKDESSTPDKDEKWRKANSFCNMFSVISLAAGLIFITIFFTTTNLGANMSDKNNESFPLRDVETKSIGTFPPAQTQKPTAQEAPINKPTPQPSEKK